jgi:fibronectin type 3 domain-containing protein
MEERMNIVAKNMVNRALLGFLSIALLLAFAACEIPTDGKFEDKISGVQRAGVMPAPQVTRIGQTLRLTWTPPERDTFQRIMRRDEQDGGTWGGWYIVGMIWTEAEAFPLSQVTTTCTFFDYFTDASKTYIYGIEGGYFDSAAQAWTDSTSEDSVRVQGVATDPLTEGSLTLSYDSTTGYLTFSPALAGPPPHASAGTPKVLLEFDNGTSVNQHLYSGPLSEIDLTTVPFASWFTKTVPIDVDYLPVYEETISTYNLHVVSYPNSYYELEGDWEGLTIPAASTTAPAMPENVGIAEIGSTWITLEWRQVTGASEYRIYRSTSRNGTYTQIGGGVPGPRYTDEGLTADSTYWYKVAAYNSAGEVPSMPIEARTSAEGKTLPAAPTNLRITATTASSISFAWNSVSGAIGYRIYRDDYSKTEPLHTLTDGETSYTDDNLRAYTGYYYTVSAYNESGEGPGAFVSGQTTTTGGEVKELLAPTGVTAVATLDGNIMVSWNPVSGATGYKIHFSRSANGNYSYDPDWTTETSYIDYDVQSGQTWYYKVLAYNDSTESPLSTYAYATALAPSQTPRLESIYVSNRPTKTTYTVGESFTSAGLTITANYSDETSQPVIGYTLTFEGTTTYDGDPKITASAGTKTIGVTYQEQMASFDITVEVNRELPRLESIYVSNRPTKTMYTVGESFTSVGLTITANYSDETSQPVIGYTLTFEGTTTYDDDPRITASAGTKTIGVTYQEQITSFDITVEAELTAPEESTGLSESEWTEGWINAGDSKWYSFSAESASTNYIMWYDNGDSDLGSYTGRIKVSAYYEDMTLIFEGAEDYEGTYFSVDQSCIIWIRVEPYDSNSAGSYAIYYTPLGNR